MTSRCERIDDMLSDVKRHVGNPCVRVPTGVTWGFERDDNGEAIVTVDLRTDQLAHNMQDDVPSSPIFAFCLAFWYQKATGRSARCRVTVEGKPPTDNKSLLHWRRSMFILAELQTVLHKRFVYSASAEWAWPPDPAMNKEVVERTNAEVSNRGKEHKLEVEIATSPLFLSSMQRICGDFEKFRRQLPVGLFSGSPRQGNRWTPGGKSQIDLWGRTHDRQTLHIFELKASGNKKVGILSEAFYYARLLHYVRVGLPGNRTIEVTGDGLEAARHAKRIVVWLAAQEFHPLVSCNQGSPLTWINAALLSDNMEFRILRLSPDNTHFVV